jgi:glycosyltransferase involved in cell wall biosynthesis
VRRVRVCLCVRMEDGGNGRRWRFVFLSGGAHCALAPEARRASGGAELQVALMARGLASRGHHVVVAGGHDCPESASWDDVHIRSAGRFDTGGLMDSMGALPRLVRIVRRERPDFIVIYGWTAWLALVCALRAFWKMRVVFVCALDGEIGGAIRAANPVRGWLFELGMRSADVRLAITEAQARAFHARGMSCAVTRLLLQPEQPPPIKDKSVDLLWVARGHPVKRPELFLDLAEAIPGARCRMICSRQDPTLWEPLTRRAKSLPQVEFLAGVPYREIQSHFDAARVFVNTSEDEGVPNTFLHAARAGCAVASLRSDPDGMFEKFGGGFSAGGSFDKLREGARILLEDPAAAARAKEGAARFLTEWHDNIRNIDAFLNGLANDRPR